LKKVGKLEKARSRDRYQESLGEQDDEVNLNNIDTDEENVDALEDERQVNDGNGFGQRDDYDDSPELQPPHFREPANHLSSKSNLHLGQLIFNNHNYVQNINMYSHQQ